MALFRTPTYDVALPFAGHWTTTMPTSYTVLMSGNYFTQTVDPDAESIEAADLAFLGGRDYVISDALGQALANAGYVVYDDGGNVIPADNTPLPSDPTDPTDPTGPTNPNPPYIPPATSHNAEYPDDDLFPADDLFPGNSPVVAQPAIASSGDDGDDDGGDQTSDYVAGAYAPDYTPLY